MYTQSADPVHAAGEDVYVINGWVHMAGEPHARHDRPCARIRQTMCTQIPKQVHVLDALALGLTESRARHADPVHGLS